MNAQSSPRPGPSPDVPDVPGVPDVPASPGSPEPRWVVVVPLKDLDAAKSRLTGIEPVLRPDAALAMAADTVCAAVEAVGRHQVWVVTASMHIGAHLRPLGAVICDDPGSGLNDAIRAGAHGARAHARAQGHEVAVAALVGDLPCLRPGDLGAVLAEAARHPRAFVPDDAGTGSVLVTAAPGIDLETHFGPGSAELHTELGATLAAPATLRLDVDDAASWRAAQALGVGPHTQALTLPA